jgi:hypothetical protein
MRDVMLMHVLARLAHPRLPEQGAVQADCSGAIVPTATHRERGQKHVTQGHSAKSIHHHGHHHHGIGQHGAE